MVMRYEMFRSFAGPSRHDCEAAARRGLAVDDGAGVGEVADVELETSCGVAAKGWSRSTASVGCVACGVGGVGDTTVVGVASARSFSGVSPDIAFCSLVSGVTGVGSRVTSK